MNKKVLILAGLCAFGLCTWEAQAVNLEYVSIINMGEEQQVGHHFMTVDYGKTNIAQVHIEY